MNFFDHQATARKKSLLLGLLFIIAVLLIVAVTNLACYFFLSFTEPPPLSLKDWFTSRPSLWISAALALTIFVGTIYQFINLSKGGKAVAQMAKGKKIDLNSNDKLEKRFINLVEEMSIASGTIMPELYVMDHEHSINAFVAGYEPTECVLVVTRGSLEQLSRDELQGIIGHEFSHILNGDMRINIRLIAVLAGILLIGQIGQFLMRLSFDHSHSRRSRSNKADIALLFIGLALICVGYTGLFLGRIIKAAISRQREFLADAASVQFTRNPEGIAGALYKIFDLHEGSRLHFTRHAEDLNHMCFSESIKLSFSGLLASHPPLQERISTIDTSYFLRFKARKHTKAKQASSKQQPESSQNISQPMPENSRGFAQNSTSPTHIDTSTATSTQPPSPPRTTIDSSSSVAAIEHTTGTVSPDHIDHAVALLAGIPSEIKTLSHSVDTARTLIMCLMLNETDKKLHADAINQLSQSAQQALNSENYLKIEALIGGITLSQRTPIFEISIGTLRNLTENQKKDFIDDLSIIANTDKKITFFEFAIITLAKQQLAASYGHKIKSKYHSFSAVSNEIALILKLFAVASTTNKVEQASRLNQAMQLFIDASDHITPIPQNARNISHALNKLRLLSPLLKRPLIDSFIECVMADNKVNTREYELLRLVAVVLDCPMPPLLTPPTQ